MTSSRGFYFPAEWFLHEATWLSWPHNTDTWPNGLGGVHEAFIKFVMIVSQGEMVCIQVSNDRQKNELNTLLADTGTNLEKVKIFQHPTNDAWCRDHGPAFVIEASQREKLIVNWGFNAWGGKYPPFELDNDIPRLIGQVLSIPVKDAPLILEGGSVELNGAGSLLTTSCCLLNENRNPNYNEQEISAILCHHYGVNQILWLHHGIAGDDTDGHIDNLARFVAEDTVVAVLEDDPGDVNYQALQQNFQDLRAMTLANGDKLNVVPLPMPQPRYWGGRRLPASYANFYIANAAVLVPTFDDPNDLKALEILRAHFTDRPVLGVDARELIVGLGGLHCLCQQEPHVPLS